MTESADIPDSPATYAEMFTGYLASNAWASAAEHMLFVFHVRKLCEDLDNEGPSNAAQANAYLSAIKALELRRPGAPKPRGEGDPAGDGGTGDQTTIFDHMDG